MSITTIVSCDALGCHQQHEDHDIDFQPNLDLCDVGWYWDEKNDCHYCPDHAQIAMNELNSAGDSHNDH